MVFHSVGQPTTACTPTRRSAPLGRAFKVRVVFVLVLVSVRGSRRAGEADVGELWSIIVFFSTKRTASYERLSSRVRATKRSASNCSVQRTRPFGGWLWAKVVRIVSILSSILGSRPARGNSFSAKSKPPSTNLCRVRRTVNQLVCKSSATSKSGFPALAKSRMFTRLIFQAPGRPFWVSETNSAFSSLFKSTMYFFAIANSFLAFGEF